MFINKTKADDAEQIPIGEAAADARCTVRQLLEAASGMQLKLHVAVRPFKYTVVELGGSRHPNFPGGSSTSQRVELLPAYAAELSNFGNANVDRFPFPDIPGVPGTFLFVLDAPQRVTIDHVWIARGHVARLKDADTATVATRHRRTLLTIIAALCKKAGIDHAGRGAAAAISSATAEIGAPVGDDSIRDLLKEIPDAIESRSR